MARNFYVLSHPQVVGEYKIGIHSKCLHALHRRYKTAIPQVQVHYFIQNINAKEFEKALLEQHSAHRIRFVDSKRKSEWIKVPLNDIEKAIWNLLADYKSISEYTQAHTNIIIVEK